MRVRRKKKPSSPPQPLEETPRPNVASTSTTPHLFTTLLSCLLPWCFFFWLCFRRANPCCERSGVRCGVQNGRKNVLFKLKCAIMLHLLISHSASFVCHSQEERGTQDQSVCAYRCYCCNNCLHCPLKDACTRHHSTRYRASRSNSSTSTLQQSNHFLVHSLLSTALSALAHVCTAGEVIEQETSLFVLCNHLISFAAP